MTDRRTRRGDIQGMRALAVLLVVASHAGVPHLAGGYIGVDVFFVISGFLITGILVAEVKRDRRIGMLDFYARRARRILPVASVVLLAITVTSWLAFGYDRARQVLDDVVWASLFGANIHSAATNSDYFATDTFISPVQHYWSLSVEEQFYLLWPALVAVVVLTSRRRPLRHLAWAILALSAGSFAWGLSVTWSDPTTAYFSPTFTRGWELGAGALLAIVAPKLRYLTHGFLRACSWLGLGAIVVAAVRFDDVTPFPGYAALLPVAGTVLLIAGGTRATPGGAGVLLDRPLGNWLGDRSYSLYLWHWPVLIIPAMAAGRDLDPVENAGLVGAALLLSAASFRWVERPVRDARFWRLDRGASLSLWPGAVSVVLATVAVIGTQTTMPPAGRVVLDPTQVAAAPDPIEAVGNAADLATQSTTIPSRLTPSPTALREANWRMDPDCFASNGEDRHQLCRLGDRDADRTVILLGDSHMGMLSAPIVSLGRTDGWTVIPIIKTGCPLFAWARWRVASTADVEPCDRWRAWAFEQVEKLHPDKLVVTQFTQTPIFDRSTGKAVSTDKGSTWWAAGAQRTMPHLAASTDDLVVIGDGTVLPKNAAECLTGETATLATCAKPYDALTATRVDSWQAATQAAGGRFVDTRRWYCSAVCPVVVGNVVVYTDRHHLTRTFAATLKPLLRTALGL